MRTAAALGRFEMLVAADFIVFTGDSQDNGAPMGAIPVDLRDAATPHGARLADYDSMAIAVSLKSGPSGASA